MQMPKLGVTKLLKKVTKSKIKNFLILWAKIKLFYKGFIIKEGRKMSLGLQIFINNCRGLPANKVLEPLTHWNDEIYKIYWPCIWKLSYL